MWRAGGLTGKKQASCEEQMVFGWAIVVVGLLYFSLLFGIASYGDRRQPAWMTGRARPFIYSFSIAVYCTAMTFFGSVDFATTNGLEFFAIFLGPIFGFALATPLLMRVARIAKAQNITSVADFIAARYGKSQSLAVVVSLGALIGLIPYIALQLQAVSRAVTIMLQHDGVPLDHPLFSYTPLIVAALLAFFAALFGTRRVNATESQRGLMLAIAMESALKLVAFLVLGAFVTWFMFDGPDLLIEQASMVNFLLPFEQMSRPWQWVCVAALSFFGIFLLPRQFHVTIVENTSEREMRYAAWMVPLYMIAINIFVAPLAVAGMLLFGDGYSVPDMYVLALPMSAQADAITLLTFIGGLSAATAMVIVESVALAIMLSNNIAIPLALSRSQQGPRDMRKFLLLVRRLSILGILLLAFAYHQLADSRTPSSLGLISFAAVAQFAPAFFGGMFWRGASCRGALYGISAGLVVWAYTLLLPTLQGTGIIAQHVLIDGPLGLGWLRPEALFGTQFSPLMNGVVWSLGINLFFYVVTSMSGRLSPLERLQANAFIGAAPQHIAPIFQGWHSPITVGELQDAVSRYLGAEPTAEAFARFATERSTRLSSLDDADVHLVRYAEHLLSAAIGASSSRLVLSLLLRRRDVSKAGAMRLLDDASIAIQYSRDLLQTAIDHAQHGMVVLDRDMQLVCWNREYARIFDIPPDLLKVGTPIDAIIRSNSERGIYGPGSVDDHLAERMERVSRSVPVFRTVVHPGMRVVETRIDEMPDGGGVVTCIDVTERVEAERALEERVNARTLELTHLNQELSRAKAAADTANFSKTRFLAAASHDILQPLNAARLYVSSLTERSHNTADAPLVANVDAALQSVEEIFSTLLDISRLDAGAMKPDISTFRLGEILRALEVEFAPMAKAKNLRLRVSGHGYWVTTDRRLLRRLLQNLVSNAVKYTPDGRVLVGCRMRPGGRLSIEVWDTGLGIAPSKQKLIFKEFQRLEPGARVASGLGLGLSIVERIARVLDLSLQIASTPGRGSVFRIEMTKGAEPSFVPAKTSLMPLSSSTLSGMRILCIDNEPAILNGMTMLLTGWGCGVNSAGSLEGARGLVDQNAPPDVIVADYHLDQGDGITAVQELRRVYARDIPAILITADRGTVVRETANRAGIAVLHKPLRPASLRALLAQFRLARSAAE
jgi:Na+/proline symporter/signal transduction histidine kinase